MFRIIVAELQCWKKKKGTKFVNNMLYLTVASLAKIPRVPVITESCAFFAVTLLLFANLLGLKVLTARKERKYCKRVVFYR